MSKENLQHIWLPYTQMKDIEMPPMAVKTKGNYIILEDGTKLIDGIASWWSVCHGYNHPHILAQTKKQLNTMPHVMLAGIANKPAYSLATRLVNFVRHKSINPNLEKVFFSDSGSTAVEVALKIAVQYFFNRGEADKCKIISFFNGYHGDTMGGMSLCDPKSGMHHKFKKYLPKQLVTKLPSNSKELASFEKFIIKNHQKAAALIIEPLVQCAGGMKFHDKFYLEQICKIANKYNILVIFDECATGFYRLGKKFAFHYLNITPDILTIGKALTGGIMTLAATLTSEKIFNEFLSKELDKALMHGPTFMGNPLSCAAANASLDLFETIDYGAKTGEIARIFNQELKIFYNHPLIKEVRVMGALAVLELHKTDWEFIFTLRKKLIAQKIWLRPFANVIYFMPPLTISAKEIKKLVKAVYNSIAKNS